MQCFNWESPKVYVEFAGEFGSGVGGGGELVVLVCLYIIIASFAFFIAGDLFVVR